MTKAQIIQTIGNDTLSAKGIAFYAGVDGPHEVLIRIQDACWELCNEGVLVPWDFRDRKHGCLFFQKATPTIVALV